MTAEVVFRRRKMTVLRYAPERMRYRMPLVVVPALIGRPSILDLHPGASFLAFLAQCGFDVYLVDWGVPGDEDQHVGLEQVILDELGGAVERVRSRTGAEGVALIGYCMGGTLALAYAAAMRWQAPNALVTLASPVDFTRGGRLARWCAADMLDLDRLLAIFPNVPATLIECAFTMLRPTAKLRARLAALQNGDRGEDPARAAIERWASDWIPFPGQAARDWITWFYRENRLLEGTLTLRGLIAQLGAIEAPLLAVSASSDEITPPDSVRPLLERISSPDRRLLELAGGHIGIVAGRSAARSLWPAVEEWLAARSPASAGRRRAIAASALGERR